MRFLLDRALCRTLFLPGASVSVGAWLGLFSVPPLIFLIAFLATVAGGTGLVIQWLVR